MSFQRIHRYRSITGICNNLENPNWGKSFTPYGRLLGANFDDGINKIRLSVCEEKESGCTKEESDCGEEESDCRKGASCRSSRKGESCCRIKESGCREGELPCEKREYVHKKEDLPLARYIATYGIKTSAFNKCNVTIEKRGSLFGVMFGQFNCHDVGMRKMQQCRTNITNLFPNN